MGSEEVEKVIFLKDIKAEQDGADCIFMVFLKNFGNDDYTYYQHVGQHGSCSINYLKQEHIIEAEPEEFSGLWDEVVSLGYEIEAVQIKETLFI